MPSDKPSLTELLPERLSQPPAAIDGDHSPEQLPIIYKDNDIVVINKPSGLLVHRSEIDRHETRFALQLVRDQIGQRVYPVHRLDKPTSGVLLFALSSEIARTLSEAFASSSISKRYHAVVRGYAPESIFVDYALKEELDKYVDKRARLDKPAQEAQTAFRRLATTELPIEIEGYPSSRYSLVECQPKTGRKHQIRRHLKHLSHPIIGDAKHGRGRHNRYFKDYLSAGRLLLHASEMEITHPRTRQPMRFIAPFDEVFNQLLTRFEWGQAFGTAKVKA